MTGLCSSPSPACVREVGDGSDQWDPPVGGRERVEGDGELGRNKGDWADGFWAEQGDWAGCGEEKKKKREWVSWAEKG